ncbi:MAG: hypothetical protein AB2690_17325 [Candidatus Thiodiazotropha endolucinida]
MSADQTGYLRVQRTCATLELLFGSGDWSRKSVELEAKSSQILV